MFHIALYCKLWSDSRVQSSAPTQTLPRGDLWSHTRTSCFRGVCSTLLWALGKATCCLMVNLFFCHILLRRNRDACCGHSAEQQLLGSFGPPLGCTGMAAFGGKREKVSGRSAISACSLISKSASQLLVVFLNTQLLESWDYRITSNVSFLLKVLTSCLQTNSARYSSSKPRNKATTKKELILCSFKKPHITTFKTIP